MATVQHLENASKDPLNMCNTRFLLNHVGQSPEEWAWRLYQLVRKEDEYLEEYLLHRQYTYHDPVIRFRFIEEVYRTLNDNLKANYLTKSEKMCRVARCDNVGSTRTSKLPFCESHEAIAQGHEHRHSRLLSGDMGRLAMFLVCYDATGYRHGQAINCLDEWCCKLLDAYLPIERLMGDYQFDTLLSFFVRAQRAVNTPQAENVRQLVLQARADVRALEEDFDYIVKQMGSMSRQLIWDKAGLFVAEGETIITTPLSP